jgi:hypothetical protein
MAAMEGYDGWSADQEEEKQGFELMKKGWVPLMIEASEVKHNKDYDTTKNKRLELTLQIVDGEYRGRKMWVSLNLWHNTSEKALRFARQDWAAICRAIGILSPSQSEELHNQVFGAKLGHKKNDQSGDLENNITAYCSNADLASKGAQTVVNNNPAPAQHGGWGANTAPQQPQAPAQPEGWGNQQQQPAGTPQMGQKTAPVQQTQAAPIPQHAPPFPVQQTQQGMPPQQVPMNDESDESIDEIPF